jgi:adenine phosphoribosyltransferase
VKHETESLIRDVLDFPKQGIVFKDITPVLADADAFASIVSDLAAPFINDGVTHVAGIEARGFILATPVATALDAGFVPIRKPGKLPYQVRSIEYSLEYGTDKLELHADAVAAGDRVLIVDDVIATGGTAAAALELIESLGAHVVGFATYVELVALQGRERLNGCRTHALVRYD